MDPESGDTGEGSLEPQEIEGLVSHNNSNDDFDAGAGDAQQDQAPQVVCNDEPLFQLREAWPPFVPGEGGLQDGDRALVVCTIDIQLLTGGSTVICPQTSAQTAVLSSTYFVRSIQGAAVVLAEGRPRRCLCLAEIPTVRTAAVGKVENAGFPYNKHLAESNVAAVVRYDSPLALTRARPEGPCFLEWLCRQRGAFLPFERVNSTQNISNQRPRTAVPRRLERLA